LLIFHQFISVLLGGGPHHTRYSFGHLFPLRFFDEELLPAFISQAAKAQRMRGLVLKNHYEPTASLAYIVRKEVPGIEILGGIDLNLSVGGMNPTAVEHMAA
jgi:hypothetical protein